MHQQPTLLIKPLSANLTRDTETFGKMDPLVEIHIGGRSYKTACHNDGGKHPQWQDVFTHVLTGEQELTFTVMDIDSISKSDVIGEGRVNLGSTYQRYNTSDWYDISYKGKPAGKVLIGLEIMNPKPGMGYNQPKV